MFRKPLQRRSARRVQHDAAAVQEEHAIAVRERPGRALFGDEHRARQMLDQVEERLCPLGIELRRRLVEQQEPGMQRERRCERHPLQLAAGQLRGQARRRAARRRRAQAPRRPATRSRPAAHRCSRGRRRARSTPGPSRSDPPGPGTPMRRCRRAVPGAPRACRSRRRRRGPRRCRRESAGRAPRAPGAASTSPSRTGRAAQRARRRRSARRRPSSTGAPAVYAKPRPLDVG